MFNRRLLPHKVHRAWRLFRLPLDTNKLELRRRLKMSRKVGVYSVVKASHTLLLKKNIFSVRHTDSLRKRRTDSDDAEAAEDRSERSNSNQVSLEGVSFRSYRRSKRGDPNFHVQEKAKDASVQRELPVPTVTQISPNRRSSRNQSVALPEHRSIDAESHLSSTVPQTSPSRRSSRNQSIALPEHRSIDAESHLLPASTRRKRASASRVASYTYEERNDLFFSDQQLSLSTVSKKSSEHSQEPSQNESVTLTEDRNIEVVSQLPSASKEQNGSSTLGTVGSTFQVESRHSERIKSQIGASASMGSTFQLDSRHSEKKSQSGANVSMEKDGGTVHESCEQLSRRTRSINANVGSEEEGTSRALRASRRKARKTSTITEVEDEPGEQEAGNVETSAELMPPPPVQATPSKRGSVEDALEEPFPQQLEQRRFSFPEEQSTIHDSSSGDGGVLHQSRSDTDSVKSLPLKLGKKKLVTSTPLLGKRKSTEEIFGRSDSGNKGRLSAVRRERSRDSFITELAEEIFGRSDSEDEGEPVVEEQSDSPVSVSKRRKTILSSSESEDEDEGPHALEVEEPQQPEEAPPPAQKDSSNGSLTYSKKSLSTSSKVRI